MSQSLVNGKKNGSHLLGEIKASNLIQFKEGARKNIEIRFFYLLRFGTNCAITSTAIPLLPLKMTNFKLKSLRIYCRAYTYSPMQSMQTALSNLQQDKSIQYVYQYCAIQDTLVTTSPLTLLYRGHSDITTVCPGSSDPFYIACQLYKLGHYFLDILYYRVAEIHLSILVNKRIF